MSAPFKCEESISIWITIWKELSRNWKKMLHKNIKETIMNKKGWWSTFYNCLWCNHSQHILRGGDVILSKTERKKEHNKKRKRRMSSRKRKYKIVISILRINTQTIFIAGLHYYITSHSCAASPLHSTQQCKTPAHFPLQQI